MKVYSMIKRGMIRVIAAILLLTGGLSVLAQQIPDDLTMEQQEKLDQYILDYIRVLRVSETQSQPLMVEEFNKKYTALCQKRAEEEYKKHGRWFYCEDNKEFRNDIRWDEVVTARIYGQLYEQYGSLENIPNYSKENHEEAIRFWQSWQRENGSFYNFFTGRGNGSDEHCNGKYVPSIMELLACKPLYKTSVYGAEKLDIEQCLNQISDLKMNWGTATVAVMMKRIHERHIGYIPVLERAVELALSQLSPQTGMFHGPEDNPSDKEWKDYGATAETMKGMARLVGYMGVENMPYRHVRADKLIQNQEQFRKGTVSVKRNTAEMMVQCLLESPYRSNELLKALDAYSGVILEGQPWNSHMTGSYATYTLMMLGAYLNWEGYDSKGPLTPFPTGAEYDYRVVVGPYGRCANVIKKRKEELLWDQNWSYTKYGLRACNTTHENRKVIEVVPATSDGWSRGADDEGRVVLTRVFTLEKVPLQNPYVKIKWRGGDIEILLNGMLVKKKLAGLSDYGAIYIPPEARKILKPGENKLEVRTIGKSGALNVSAGLIDWKLREEE